MMRTCIALCTILVLIHIAVAPGVKKLIDKTRPFSVYAEECREDLNECLDHSWAHLPDSPPIGYCCEHYNYCLYGP